MYNYCKFVISFSLLVQLARDLQTEFYPYFKDFFPLLVSLCNAQDVSIIEVQHMIVT